MPTLTTKFSSFSGGAGRRQPTWTRPSAVRLRLTSRLPTPLGRLPAAVPVGLPPRATGGADVASAGPVTRLAPSRAVQASAAQLLVECAAVIEVEKGDVPWGQRTPDRDHPNPASAPGCETLVACAPTSTAPRSPRSAWS